MTEWKDDGDRVLVYPQCDNCGSNRDQALPIPKAGPGVVPGLPMIMVPQVGPCPCGGQYKVPPILLNGPIIALLQGPLAELVEANIERSGILNSLGTIHKARADGASPEEVLSRLESSAPAVHQILARWGWPKDRDEFVKTLTLLIAVLEFLLAASTCSGGSTTTVNHNYYEAPAPEAKAERLSKQKAAGGGLMKSSEPQVTEHRGALGRNDPCYCGSGKKLKKCHDAPPPVAKRLNDPDGG